MSHENLLMDSGFTGLHPHSNSGFFETSRFVRLWILFFLSAGIFLFLSQKVVRVPFFEVGTIASKSVVSEIPFTAVDELATDAAFIAHVREIGPLYMLRKEEISKRQQEIETGLVKNPKWREIRPAVKFEDMAQAVSMLGGVLLRIRFGSACAIDDYEDFSKTGDLNFEIGMVDPEKGLCLTDAMLNQIQNVLVQKHHFNSQIVLYIVDMLKEKIWFLTEASHLTKWRKWEKQKFPLQYNRFPCGTVVVRAEDTVTLEHQTRLDGLRRALEEQAHKNVLINAIGNAVLTAVIVVVCVLFFRYYYPGVLRSSSLSLMISSIVLLVLLWAKIYEVVMFHLPKMIGDGVQYPILMPMMGMLLCILVNPFVAIVLTSVFAVVMSISLSFDAANFLTLNLIVSLICIFYTRTLRRRAEIVVVCSRGFLAAVCVIFALCMLDPNQDFPIFCVNLGATAIFMMATAIAIIGLLPIFECAFHVLTDINLMEYMNPNNPLLKRLMTEAPGTYQHSLLLGSLAEAAATAIGGDGLFCRVATLYHDIGKVCISQYFSENQDNGMNIHQLLTPKESARVIVSHVQEGVNLARREGLPEAFIDIIKEHHGTGLVYYFYHKQLEASENNPKLVFEKDFRYLGPKPRSKEAAIVMIADCFEAACRSVEDVTEVSLMKLIEQIVREKMEDGQFDECPMSFEELCKVKRALVKCIISIGHFRVKYPTKKRLESEASIPNGRPGNVL